MICILLQTYGCLITYFAPSQAASHPRDMPILTSFAGTSYGWISQDQRPTWRYKPKKSFKYHRTKSFKYHRGSRQKYSPKRSFKYHPKKSWKYNPKRTWKHHKAPSGNRLREL